MGNIATWIQANWLQVVGTLWLLEQVMRAISELTPWTFDDNITKWFTKILKSFFPKKKG